ncbi:MAG TPA: ribosome recycling factor [Deltaproteobacteria bacterium]|nr:ribosome recycling factor [Deltaproteobacteria bacterium]
MDEKSKVLKSARGAMEKTVEALVHEMQRLRTGRASLAILDGITVDCYGSRMPLNQVATLAVPESRVITIQPWDSSLVQAIEKAILSSDLGITPSNDGRLIRITIPPLNEERRRELVKVAKKYVEEGRVSIRNTRREANDSLKKLEKEKVLTQDDLKKAQHEVQELTDRFIARLDEILAQKEKEIMEV